MTDYRKQKLNKLAGNTPTETERVLTKLVIERVCDDMCDFYDRFYYFEGPGAMVYVPTAKEEKNSMFYMSVAASNCSQRGLSNQKTWMELPR
jgi:hypothetical protein